MPRWLRRTSIPYFGSLRYATFTYALPQRAFRASLRRVQRLFFLYPIDVGVSGSAKDGTGENFSLTCARRAFERLPAKNALHRSSAGSYDDVVAGQATTMRPLVPLSAGAFTWLPWSVYIFFHMNTGRVCCGIFLVGHLLRFCVTLRLARHHVTFTSLSTAYGS